MLREAVTYAVSVCRGICLVRHCLQAIQAIEAISAVDNIYAVAGKVAEIVSHLVAFVPVIGPFISAGVQHANSYVQS